MPKSTLFSLALAVCFALPVLAAPDSQEAENIDLPPLDLYLLVGQSNMAGRGEIEEIDRTAHPRVFALGPEDTWIPAVEPLHFDKKNRGTGPGLALGKAIAEAKPDATIGLIPSAVGGTIISYWAPDHERGLYKEAVRRARVAMKSGTLRAIIWQQGESDSTAERAPLYKDRLIALMTQFREDLGASDVPIVLGGLGSFLKSPHYKTVNAAIEEAADELPNAIFVPASDKGHIGDRLHFNAAAQRENGARQAKAALEIEERSP